MADANPETTNERAAEPNGASPNASLPAASISREAIAPEGIDFQAMLPPNVIAPGTPAQEGTVPQKAVSQNTAPHAVPQDAGPRSAVSPNLDLLLDVELPVSVKFGSTQAPLRDVLKLSSGSIVELNRLANEPVEVLINDYVIARGEVVVVDGNYGIRITEVVSRQERIQSML